MEVLVTGDDEQRHGHLTEVGALEGGTMLSGLSGVVIAALLAVHLWYDRIPSIHAFQRPLSSGLLTGRSSKNPG